MPINFNGLTYDDWYSWDILQFSDAAWGPAVDAIAVLDGAVLRATWKQEPLVAAFRGGDGQSDVYLLTDSGTAVSVPGAVLGAATHLPSHRSTSGSGSRLEVTPRLIGSQTYYLVRGGDTVVGYLDAAAAAASANALT